MLDEWMGVDGCVWEQFTSFMGILAARVAV